MVGVNPKQVHLIEFEFLLSLMSRVTQVMFAIIKPFNKRDLTRVRPLADFKQAGFEPWGQK